MLGTVQAYNTVTVKVRVDGEVQKIAFREGQDVQVGDVMAQIDPRPYEAQLHQAEADMARDEALLANARLDLERYSKLAVKEFATRQSVDTQEALVAQYQAAIAHDQAVIDNARVQLGYTTIVSPLAGRTGIRLIDQGNSAGWKRQHGDEDMLSNWRSPPRPGAKSPEQVDRITGSTGKSIEGERVTDGFVVALRRGNARGAKEPCCL